MARLPDVVEIRWLAPQPQLSYFDQLMIKKFQRAMALKVQQQGHQMAAHSALRNKPEETDGLPSSETVHENGTNVPDTDNAKKEASLDLSASGGELKQLFRGDTPLSIAVTDDAQRMSTTPQIDVESPEPVEPTNRGMYSALKEAAPDGSTTEHTNSENQLQLETKLNSRKLSDLVEECESKSSSRKSTGRKTVHMSPDVQDDPQEPPKRVKPPTPHPRVFRSSPSLDEKLLSKLKELETQYGKGAKRPRSDGAALKKRATVAALLGDRSTKSEVVGQPTKQPVAPSDVDEAKKKPTGATPAGTPPKSTKAATLTKQPSGDVGDDEKAANFCWACKLSEADDEWQLLEKELNETKPHYLVHTCGREERRNMSPVEKDIREVAEAVTNEPGRRTKPASMDDQHDARQADEWALLDEQIHEPELFGIPSHTSPPPPAPTTPTKRELHQSSVEKAENASERKPDVPSSKSPAVDSTASSSLLQPALTLNEIIAAAKRKSITPSDTSIPTLASRQCSSFGDKEKESSDDELEEKNSLLLEEDVGVHNTPPIQLAPHSGDRHAGGPPSKQSSVHSVCDDEAKEIAMKMMDTEDDHQCTDIQTAPPQYLSLDAEDELIVRGRTGTNPTITIGGRPASAKAPSVASSEEALKISTDGGAVAESDSEIEMTNLARRMSSLDCETKLEKSEKAADSKEKGLPVTSTLLVAGTDEDHKPGKRPKSPLPDAALLLAASIASDKTPPQSAKVAEQVVPHPPQQAASKPVSKRLHHPKLQTAQISTGSSMEGYGELAKVPSQGSYNTSGSGSLDEFDLLPKRHHILVRDPSCERPLVGSFDEPEMEPTAAGSTDHDSPVTVKSVKA